MSGIPGFTRWVSVCGIGRVVRVPASPIEMDLARRLGLRLRRLREERGLTQESMASRTAIDLSMPQLVAVLLDESSMSPTPSQSRPA